MKVVNIQEAQSDLTRLIEDAANGEPFVITRDGKPLVKVEPVEEMPAVEKRPKRRAGFLKGHAKIPDDFTTMYAKEIEEMFYGK